MKQRVELLREFVRPHSNVSLDEKDCGEAYLKEVYSTPLVKIIKDRYGNFIIQAMLKLAKHMMNAAAQEGVDERDVLRS